jgi:hypothetical protein
MNTFSRIGLVLGGFVVAFSVASVLVYIRQLRTSEPDTQASPGMYAAGDIMLFVMEFTVLALIPTGFGLYFLRSYGKFWAALSIVALTIAITGPVGGCLSALTINSPMRQSPLVIAGDLGFLRAMGAPLLVLGFLTCAAFAPSRRPRWALLVATRLECAASAYFVIRLWLARAPYGL